MKIPLFLPDFRKFVRKMTFTPELQESPVFYFETDNMISFYKPVKDIL